MWRPCTPCWMVQGLCTPCLVAQGPCTPWGPCTSIAAPSQENPPKAGFRTVTFLGFVAVSRREGKKPLEVFGRSVVTCEGTQWLSVTKEQSEGSCSTPQSWFSPLPPVSTPLGLLMHLCCILVLAGLSGSGAALGWVFLMPHPMLWYQEGICTFFLGICRLLLQPAHCQTSQHPACAGNDGNLEWPFFLVPLSPPEFPKTSQIGAWGLVKFFWTLSGRSLCVLAVPGSSSQCSQPPLHLFSSSGCALIKQFLNNLLSVESYFFAAGSPKQRKSRNAMNSQCVDWVRFLGM